MDAVKRWLSPRPVHALVLAAALLLGVTVRWHHDVVASDPLWYAAIAHQISVDPGAAFAAPENHPFEMRIGLTVPLALLYRLFGVSTLVTLLPCLLAGLAILGVVYAAAATPRAKVLGMVLAVACTPLFRHAGLLNVDLPCAALLGVSVLGLARRDGAAGRAWAAAAMLAWFGAFLVKESALWCLPVWLYAVIVDLRADGVAPTLRRFAPALLIGAALALGYLALCHVVWGDALARFAGVADLADQHNWSLAGQPPAVWLERLTWGPPRLLARMFRLELLPLLLAPWLVVGRARLWWVATAGILGLFWFGSASVASYDPLPLLPRMLLPLLPMLLVSGALASDAALTRLVARWPATRWPALALLSVALLWPALGSMRSSAAQGRPDSAAYAALRSRVEASPRPSVVVCGAYPCAALASFHFGFAPPARLTFATSAAFAAAPLPTGAAVYALNASSRSIGASARDPRYRQLHAADPAALPRLLQAGDVELYGAGDGARLHQALR